MRTSRTSNQARSSPDRLPALADHEPASATPRSGRERPQFSFDQLATKLRELAYLDGGLQIDIIDERTDRKQVFEFEGGIATYVADLSASKTPVSGVVALSGTVSGSDGEANECFVDVAMQVERRPLRDPVAGVARMTARDCAASSRYGRRPDERPGVSRGIPARGKALYACNAGESSAIGALERGGSNAAWFNP